jgi:hypothetical protein
MRWWPRPSCPDQPARAGPRAAGRRLGCLPCQPEHPGRSLDNVGRRSISRADARQLLSERRENEIRQREIAERQERQAIERDRQWREQLRSPVPQTAGWRPGCRSSPTGSSPTLSRLRWYRPLYRIPSLPPERPSEPVSGDVAPSEPPLASDVIVASESLTAPRKL